MYQELANLLAQEVVNQPEAVRSFARTGVRALDGRFRGHRPVSVLMIGGPAGSGKSSLIETFGRFLFGRERRVIKVNASFHRQAASCIQYLATACAAHDASRLPGESDVRLVYVDRIERSPASVLDLFIHIFSNGDLQLDTSHVVDFRRTIFVLETALGEHEVDQVANAAVGFKVMDPEAIAEQEARIREHVLAKIQETFPVRFLVELDDVIVFRRIWDRDLPQILEHVLAKLSQALSTMGIALHVDEAVRDFLLAEGRRALRYGGRGLRIAAARYLETPLIDAMSLRPLAPGSVIYARRSMDGVAFFVPG